MTNSNQQQDPQQKQPVDYSAGDDETAEKLVLTSPDAAGSPRDFALWAGVLFLLALTIYSPAMRGEFLWDDDRHVTRNATLRSADGLRRIWTERFATPQYYPLTHTTYWVEYQLFGKGAGAETLNPLVFHVTNDLLHAAGATLLWFILRRLRVPGAWLAAAVFAVHPVHAESVAWISERKNVLSGALMFASILAYLRFERIGGDKVPLADRPDVPRDDWNVYALSLGLFICALLSKTVACSMPAVMLLLIWWKRGGIRLANILPLLPFFAIGLVMAGLTSWIERSHVIGEHYKYGDWELSALQRILLAGRALWFYARKLVLPLELTFTYPRWDVDPAQVWQWAFVLAAVAVPVVLWVMRKRIGRAPLAGALIFIGVLVPALGFVDVYPMRYSLVADHFQYHASPALIALIVAGVVIGFRRLSRRPEGVNEQSPTPYVASAVVLLVLGMVTWRQAFIYADAVTLWRDTVAKNPNAWMAHHNLGYELTDLARGYQQLGDDQSKEHAKELLDEAVGHLETAVKLRPTHDTAIMHWGRALLAQGRDQEAMQKFEEALKVNPANVEAMTNRGFMLQKFKKLDEAIAAYRDALATCEKGPAALHGRCGQIARLLGGALEAAGKQDEALVAYTRAVQLAPGNVEARYDLGTLLARRAEGTPEERRTRQIEAANQFLEIIRRDPRHQDARISHAQLMIEVGNFPGAHRELVAVAAINKESPRLLEAAKLWNAAQLKYEASTQPSTQPSTTQSSTPPTTGAAAGAATTKEPATTQPVP